MIPMTMKKAKMTLTIQMSKINFINIYSSEDSSSNSKSHESVSEKKTPMKKPDTKHVSSAEKIIKKKIPMKIKEEEKSSKVELKKISRSIASPKVLKTKNSLVSQLLTRWWYALPKWPPEDFDPRYVMIKTI